MNETAYHTILQRLGLESSSTSAPAPPDWLGAWRELARLTDGMLPDDSRLQPILMALRRCDDTFLANDWPAFQRAVEQVRQAVQRT